MNSDLFKLHTKILEDSSLTFEQKKEMFNEIRKIMPPSQNRWHFRYAILPLAIVALSVPAYAFIMMFYTNQSASIPDALLSLGSTALGAIAAFLTNHTEKEVTSNPEDEKPATNTENKGH